MSGDHRTAGDRRSRAQTLQDFAIGMTVFLVVLGYVFAFVPSLFGPFSPDAGTSTTRADRVADFLTRDGMTVNDTADGVLEPVCTDEFFSESLQTPPDDCPFSDTEFAVLLEDAELNVTMERDGAIATHPTTGTPLRRNDAPPESASRVIRAVRTVTLDGRDHRFVVRIW